MTLSIGGNHSELSRIFWEGLGNGQRVVVARLADDVIWRVQDLNVLPVPLDDGLRATVDCDLQSDALTLLSWRLVLKRLEEKQQRYYQ